TVGAKVEHDYFSGWQIQPTIRTLWAPDKRKSAWASVSRAVRTPSFYERYSSSTIGSLPAADATGGLPAQVTINGSARYGEESLKAFELGYRTQVSKILSVDMAGFFNQYSGLKSAQPSAPILIPSATPFLSIPYFYGNQGHGSGQGAEVSASWLASSRW